MITMFSKHLHPKLSPISSGEHNSTAKQEQLKEIITNYKPHKSMKINKIITKDAKIADVTAKKIKNNLTK
jgi:hypothetical protein